MCGAATQRNPPIVGLSATLANSLPISI